MCTRTGPAAATAAGMEGAAPVARVAWVAATVEQVVKVDGAVTVGQVVREGLVVGRAVAVETVGWVVEAKVEVVAFCRIATEHQENGQRCLPPPHSTQAHSNTPYRLLRYPTHHSRTSGGRQRRC